MSYPSNEPANSHGKQTDQLHERYELFESFINQSSEGICLFDQNGRILEWNAGCEVYFGIPYAEAIKKIFGMYSMK